MTSALLSIIHHIFFNFERHFHSIRALEPIAQVNKIIKFRKDSSTVPTRWGNSAKPYEYSAKYYYAGNYLNLKSL